MTQLDVYRPSGIVSERDVVDGWVSVVTDVGNLADYIAQTDFVPRALRGKPAAVAACILTGRELGIGPMASLKSIHMVQGVPSLSAEYKRARAMAAGHEILIDETSPARCVVRGRRSGSGAWVTVQWTIDMARRAKIASKDVWQQYPQRMLQARATSELCDLLFPDATLGLETTEVLQDGGALAIAEGAVIESAEEAAAIEAPKVGKPRTARRTRTKAEARPTAAAPAAAPAPTSAPAPAQTAPPGDLPPLPGEEETPSGSGQPAGNEPAAGPDGTGHDTPGTVTDAQLKAIWTVLGTAYHFDKDDRDSARQVCARVTGHELESSKDLSKNEAKAILDTLAHWQEQARVQGEDPRAYLMAVMAGTETEPAS